MFVNILIEHIEFQMAYSYTCYYTNGKRIICKFGALVDLSAVRKRG